MIEYIVIAVLALYVISESFNRRERGKLLNRLMAKNLPEFKYYEDKWKGDLKEISTVREETREELKEELKMAKKEEGDEGDEDLF